MNNFFITYELANQFISGNELDNFSDYFNKKFVAKIQKYSNKNIESNFKTELSVIKKRMSKHELVLSRADTIKLDNKTNKEEQIRIENELIKLKELIDEKENQRIAKSKQITKTPNSTHLKNFTYNNIIEPNNIDDPINSKNILINENHKSSKSVLKDLNDHKSIEVINEESDSIQKGDSYFRKSFTSKDQNQTEYLDKNAFNLVEYICDHEENKPGYDKRNFNANYQIRNPNIQETK